MGFCVLWIRWEKLLVKQISRLPLKIGTKRAIEKTVRASDDLIGNKIVNKITNASKTSSEIATNLTKNIELHRKIPKKIYISRKKKKVIDDLKLM